MAVFSTGKGFSVKIPDLANSLRDILLVFDPKNAARVYKKGLMAAAKPLVAKAKELAPGPGKGSRGKGKKRKFYGKTGALKKSIKAYFRKGKQSKSPYVVIGANRDTRVEVQRGKQTAYSQPSNYVHLVEKGFTAVSRIQGVKGRDLHYEVLRGLRHQEWNYKSSRTSFKAALEKGLDKKLLTSRFVSEEKRLKAGIYLQGYKGATKTRVPGQFFMKRAQREAKDAAIAAAKAALEKSFAELVSPFRVK